MAYPRYPRPGVVSLPSGELEKPYTGGLCTVQTQPKYRIHGKKKPEYLICNHHFRVWYCMYVVIVSSYLLRTYHTTCCLLHTWLLRPMAQAQAPSIGNRLTLPHTSKVPLYRPQPYCSSESDPGKSNSFFHFPSCTSCFKRVVSP